MTRPEAKRIPYTVTFGETPDQYRGDDVMKGEDKISKQDTHQQPF